MSKIGHSQVRAQVMWAIRYRKAGVAGIKWLEESEFHGENPGNSEVRRVNGEYPVSVALCGGCMGGIEKHRVILRESQIIIKKDPSPE